MYIYQKQLEEADLIVLNKTDLLSAEELAEVEGSLRREFPQAPVVAISALNGTGVATWLDYLLEHSESGRTIAEVDYDQYADGEAALGWLNAALRLEAVAPIDWRAFALELMKALQRQFLATSAEVAHLKLHLSAGDGALVANLTANDSEPLVRGRLEGSPQEMQLLVNVRAEIDPETLRTLTEQCLEQVAGASIRRRMESLESFAPGRPTPVHRFKQVV
jgi:Fe2+ transport system protein B